MGEPFPGSIALCVCRRCLGSLSLKERLGCNILLITLVWSFHNTQLIIQRFAQRMGKSGVVGSFSRE